MIIKEIEQLAEEILSLAGNRKVPIAVEEIAKYFKLRVGKAPSKDFSGLLLRKEGSALIGVNDSEPPQRQRFTIAHELGHFFLHTSKEAFVDYRNSKHPRTPKEREADSFAAALLMPRKEITQDFTKTMSGIYDQDHFEKAVSLLSTKYDVSEEAMRIRLLTLSTNL